MNARLKFRPLTTKDFELTYEWAHNDERVKWSFSKKRPTLNEHFEYMLESLRCPMFYIAEFKNKPLGYVRVKHDGEISVYVVPEHRGQGVGEQLVNLAKTKFDYLYAMVLVGNKPSFKLFKKCGFKHVNRMTRFKQKCHIFVWGVT